MRGLRKKKVEKRLQSCFKRRSRTKLKKLKLSKLPKSPPHSNPKWLQTYIKILKVLRTKITLISSTLASKSNLRLTPMAK